MKKSGFTLVEIMIVVAIIGLLAAIAIPSFVKSRNTSQQNACINNLRQIDSAKEQAAMAENWPTAQIIAVGSAEETTIISYIKGTTVPTCPAGATITVNPLDTNPSCNATVTAHVL